MARKNITGKNQEYSIDFKGEKVVKGLGDINDAQKQTLDNMTNMITAMEIYSKSASKEIDKLQNQLEKLDGSKQTRAIKSQSKQIKNIIADTQKAQLTAESLLTEKNINPQKITSAFKDMGLSLVEAEKKVKLISAELKQQALLEREAEAASKEGLKTVLQEMLETTTNAAERLAIEKQIRDILSEQAEIEKEKANITKSVADIEKTSLERSNKIQDQTKDAGGSAKTADMSKLEAVKNTFSDIANIMSTVLNTINISNLAQSLEIEDSARKSVRKQSMATFGQDTDEFEVYKDEVIDAMSSGVEGLFNSSDLYQVLTDLNSFGFETAEQAAAMSQQIAYGNKLLSLSTDTQVAAYQLQRKTGVTDIIEKQNDRIAGLLSSQLGVSKEQLDAIEASNLDFSSEAIVAGMGTEYIDTAMEQLNAIDIADPSGVAKQLITEFMNASLDQQALMAGERIGEAHTAIETGQFKDLYDVLTDNALVNTKATYLGDALTTNALSNVGSSTALTAVALKGDFDSMYNEVLSAQQEGDVDAYADEVLDTMTTQEKLMNSISLSLEQLDWGNLIAIDETVGLIETGVVGIIALLGTLVTLQTAQTLLSKTPSGSTVASALKSSTAAGGLFEGVLPGASSIGTGTKILGGASLAAGVAWTATDAIKGYNTLSSDLYGEDATTGQKVGSSIIGAVSGTNVATSENAYDGITGSAMASLGVSEEAAATTKNVGGGALSGAGKGALIGAGIGSFIPGVGTVIGGAVGGVIGAVSGAIGGGVKDTAAKDLQEQLSEQSEEELALQKATQEILSDISNNTFNTERALGSLGTAVSVRWRSDQLNYGGGQSPVPTQSSAAASIPEPAVEIGDKNTLAMGGVTATSINKDMGGEWNGIETGSYTMTSAYGYRNNPTGSGTQFHSGIDFGAPANTPIGSSIAGTVTQSGWSGGYGNLTVIKGEDGRSYYYAHQVQAPPVDVGQSVSAGQLIGYVGSTGNSTGNHLHYEVRENGTAISPNSYVNTGIFNLDPNASTNTGVSTDSSSSSSSSSATVDTDTKSILTDTAKRSFTYDLANIGGVGGGVGGPDNTPVIAGLDRINTTLIELAEKQEYQQKIIDAMSTKKISLSM